MHQNEIILLIIGLILAYYLNQHCSCGAEGFGKKKKKKKETAKEKAKRLAEEAAAKLVAEEAAAAEEAAEEAAAAAEAARIAAEEEEAARIARIDELIANNGNTKFTLNINTVNNKLTLETTKKQNNKGNIKTVRLIWNGTVTKQKTKHIYKIFIKDWKYNVNIKNYRGFDLNRPNPDQDDETFEFTFRPQHSPSTYVSRPTDSAFPVCKEGYNSSGGSRFCANDEPYLHKVYHQVFYLESDDGTNKIYKTFR